MKTHYNPGFSSQKFVFTLFSILICLSSTLYAEMKDVCELNHLYDFGQLKDTTIPVPDNVVAVTPNVRVKNGFRIDTTRQRATSVFIIIQHSESMGRAGADPEGKRFSVASALIDTLYRFFKDSVEVGLAICSEHLYFDPQDDFRFIQTPEQDTGAYLPLFMLDSSFAPDGKMGYEIIKEYLETLPGQPNTLRYKPTRSVALNANINAGFDAAQHAFKSSKIRKKNRLVIFFTDGEADRPVDSPNSFIDDVKEGIPTTFTIHFTPDGKVPANLLEMTDNIRASIYCVFNDSSNLFTIDSGPNKTLSFTYNNYYTLFINEVFIRPFNLCFGLFKIPNTIFDAQYSYFYLDHPFPLTGVSTSLSYLLNYQIIDSAGNSHDSSSYIEFNVTIQPGIDLPDPNDLKCWERSLDFYNNNTLITTANETMSQLEIRFEYDTGDAGYKYTNVNIELMTVSGSIQDKENFTLTNSGNFFTRSFPLQLLTDSQYPIQNDSILQCHATDSLIAIFRNSENPKLPLDTLRKALPYNGTIGIHNQASLANGKMYYTLSNTGTRQQILRVFNLPSYGKLSLYTINGKKILRQNINRGNSHVVIPKNISSSVVLMKLEYGKQIIRSKQLLQ